MASFQIHTDQENLVSNSNVGRLRNNPAKNIAKVTQKRTILGDLSSNSSRVNTRSSKQDVNVFEKPLKGKNNFVIHEDKPAQVSKPTENVVSLENCKKHEFGLRPKPSRVPEPKKPTEDKENNKLDLSDAIISAPRQPLKDLKLSDAVDEESEGCSSEYMPSPMSESYLSSPELPSPMSLESVLSDAVDEESEACSSEYMPSPMSESYSSSPEPPSPMSLESVVISSPLLRHSKPSLQLLYDMDVYRAEIFQYLLQAEKRARPKPLYMRRQPDVTYSMRSILVDWLVEVAEEYKLSTETLYLAVSFIDRFLSVMSVVKGKLQLLGTAAMFVASKYEEIYPPDVGEFVYITDDTYNKRQVLRMEQLILKVLSFDISVPTIFAFLQHIAVDCNLSVRLTTLAQYLCELTLLEGDPYLAFVPSIVACSALAVARHCLSYDEVWSAQLQKSSGYSLSELAPCVAHFNTTHSQALDHKQQAICDKYKAQKFYKVAEIQPKALRI